MLQRAMATVIFITAVVAFSAVKKGPYMVWNGDNTAMTVLWQFDATQAGSIAWGTTTSYELGSANTAEYGSDHQHSYTITGLTPGQKYFYSVTGAGTGSFTAAPPSDAQNVKLLAYGDTRTNPTAHNGVCGGMIDAYTADPAKQTIALLSGDWVLYGNQESNWTNEFFPRNQPDLLKFQSEVPLCGPMGNHENFTGNLLNKYFPQPGGTNYYYSFDYGPAHIAIINQYIAYTPGSTQYNWLESDLANSTKLWKIIVFHEPAYATGEHGDNTTAQTVLHPLCMQYGVDIAVTGHNHLYAHALKDGIHHITAGGGGAPLVSGTTYNSPYTQLYSINYHFCEIDIAGSTLTFTAKLPNGTVIDNFQVTRTPPSPTVTLTAPAAGSELAVGTETSIIASVDDAGGTCTKVSFHANYGDGDVLIGEDTTEPRASYSWTPTAAGLNVSLTAKADVNMGGSYEYPVSSPVTVAVIDPNNAAPIADAGDDQTIVDDGDGTANVNLDGSGSSDPDGSILSWTWKEGSIALGSGEVLYNVPFALGFHTVTLEVTDNGGKKASNQMTVNIQSSSNQEPLADAGPDLFIIDADGNGIETVTLDGSGSGDVDGTIIKYEWDFTGDGTYDEYRLTGEPTITHDYPLGNHVAMLRVTDNNDAVHTDAVSITVLEEGALTVVSKRAASGNDDAEEDVSGEGSYSDVGDIDLTSSDLELGRDNQLSRDQLVAVRFIGCTIPNGATILSAYIQFTCDETGSDVTSVTIKGEAADNAAGYTSTTYDISTRAVTSESVTWTVPAWATVGAATTNERTPDIAPVVQEIAGRGGFSESSAIAFIISGTGRRTAESYDGASSSAPLLHVEYILGPPNQAPVVSITAPAQGANVAPPVTVTADASDPDGSISNVQFYANGNKIGQDESAPFEISWSGMVSGNYALTAVATDDRGATGTSGTVTVSVEAPNVPPACAITAPMDGALFTSPAEMTVIVDASDIDGTVDSIELLVNGSRAGVLTAEPYEFSLTGLNAGSYSLTAAAVDNDDATTTSTPVSITVEPPNVPPTVSIASPVNGATFTAPATVVITADASDYDGMVSLVEFFNGAAKIGEDDAAPFSFSWSNVSAGSYSLTAVAADNDGATATSAPVSITVEAPPTPVIVSKRIAAGLDDVEEYANGTVLTNSTVLELVYASKTTGNQTIGLRFASLGIPQNATITTAYLQFTADVKTNGTNTVLVRGEAADNAAAFAGTTKNVSNRTKTASNASWAIPSWTAGQSGTAQRTPELKTVVQEIVSRGGFTSSSAMVFIITGSGTKKARAFEKSSSTAPLLHIEFTE